MFPEFENKITTGKNWLLIHTLLACVTHDFGVVAETQCLKEPPSKGAYDFHAHGEPLAISPTLIGALRIEYADHAEERTDGLRTVTAKRPNHVWHVDLTVVPTASGFWAPWFPFALPQIWPFCWRVACTADHYSRTVLGFAVFKQHPTSAAVRAFLGRAVGKSKACPKYIICDQGSQFTRDGFKAWCKRKNIRPRCGADHRYGRIAVIERFIKSLKDEWLRRLVISLSSEAMRHDLSAYAF